MTFFHLIKKATCFEDFQCVCAYFEVLPNELLLIKFYFNCWENFQAIRRYGISWTGSSFKKYIRNRDSFLVSQVTDAFEYFLYINYYLLVFSYWNHDLFYFYGQPNSSSFRYLVFFCLLLKSDIYYLMALSNAERAWRCWEKKKATGLSHIMK